MASGSGELESDLRVALLTGAAGWRDRNSHYTRAELATAGILVVLVVAVMTVLLTSAGLPSRDAAIDGAARWVLAVTGTVTLAVAIGPSVAWPLGWRPRRSGPVRPFAAVRVAATMLLVGCWTALLGSISHLPVWILGGVVGCEYTLTAWALGVRTDGPTWWWRFQRSSVHLGVWLLTVGAALVYPERVLDLLRIPLSLQLIAVAAAATCHALERLRRSFDHRAERTVLEVATVMHSRLAHWLHDEVTSSLGLLRFRLKSGEITPEELGSELDQLDHRIRMRQLDELLAAGRARLAEVIQPFVRLAQDQGVEVVDVPSLDESSVVLGGQAGHLVQRSLGVLVPNAIAAGASRLAFRVELDRTRQDRVAIEVEDDAGGLDLASIPPGRGLNGLQRDLGADRISCMPTPAGSRLRVVIDGQPEGAA